MTEKMLARVAVSSVPYAADRLYTYLVPDELIGSAEAGKRVTIPFGRGNRRVEGFLLEIGREAAASPRKPIDAVLDDAPLLDSRDIRLVRWMKARYFCTYYDAIKTIQQVLKNVVITDGSSGSTFKNVVLDGVTLNQQNLKAAAIFIAMLPIICVYPFVQKYFKKGILIGSVKG